MLKDGCFILKLKFGEYEYMTCVYCSKNCFEICKMSGYGLQKFRENLTLAYLNDLVDVDDFVYVYAANQSKSIYPYWKFDIKFNLENLDDTECHYDFLALHSMRIIF